MIDDEEVVQTAPIREDVSKSGKPFAPPAPRALTPTAAQNDWLRKNKGHIRMSHIGHVLKFNNRGTLHPDGSFVAEAPGKPVMDGNGAFGVGVPLPPR